MQKLLAPGYSLTQTLSLWPFGEVYQWMEDSLSLLLPIIPYIINLKTKVDIFSSFDFIGDRDCGLEKGAWLGKCLQPVTFCSPPSGLGLGQQNGMLILEFMTQKRSQTFPI